jgi:hypothetical protein
MSWNYQRLKLSKSVGKVESLGRYYNGTVNRYYFRVKNIPSQAYYSFLQNLRIKVSNLMAFFRIKIVDLAYAFYLTDYDGVWLGYLLEQKYRHTKNHETSTLFNYTNQLFSFSRCICPANKKKNQWKYHLNGHFGGYEWKDLYVYVSKSKYLH